MAKESNKKKTSNAVQMLPSTPRCTVGKGNPWSPAHCNITYFIYPLCPALSLYLRPWLHPVCVCVCDTKSFQDTKRTPGTARQCRTYRQNIKHGETGCAGLGRALRRVHCNAAERTGCTRLAIISSSLWACSGHATGRSRKLFFQVCPAFWFYPSVR